VSAETLEGLVRAIVRDELARGRASAVVVTYSQRDGERPTGCGRAKYLRVHRRAREARDAGATSPGRSRLLTHDAWQRYCDALPSRASKPASAEPSLEARVLKLLGARRAS
jgi:hypothetical protein